MLHSLKQKGELQVATGGEGAELSLEIVEVSPFLLPIGIQIEPWHNALQ